MTSRTENPQGFEVRRTVQPDVAILDEPSENMPPLVYTSNIKAFASMPNAQIIKFKSSITKVSTPPLGAQALKGQTPASIIRNLKLLFMFEPTLEELHQFHNIMAERFNVNVFEFDSLAQIGETTSWLNASTSTFLSLTLWLKLVRS